MASFGWKRQLGAMDIRASVPETVANFVSPVSFSRLNARWASAYQARLRVRNARVIAARRVLTPRQAMAMGAAMGIGRDAFGGLIDDVMAAREELENVAELDPVAIAESYRSMSADGIGQALGGLGLPIDNYAVIRGCAREQFRRAAGEASGLLTYADANVDHLYALIGDYGATAAEYFGEMRVAVSRYLGGNAGQVVDLGQRLADWWSSNVDGEMSLIRAQIQAVGSGIRGVVDRATATSTDWITPEMRSAAGAVIRAIQSGVSSRDAASLLSSIGTGLGSVSVAMGPAAPYVAAAGAAVSAASMLGSMLASILVEPPPARVALRPYAEHWAILKLYLSAFDNAYDPESIENLKTNGWDVRCDPVTGETVAKPPGGWRSPRPGWTTRWNSYIRVIDLFDRRTLINPRTMDWVKTGRGIMFDGYSAMPCNIYNKVPVVEDFVRFAGAETFSPVPRNPGSNWPVGPNIDNKGYYGSRTYRSAVLAAAAIGGCPPYASYGIWKSGLIGESDGWHTPWPDCAPRGLFPGDDGRSRWCADATPHCLGIGGNKLYLREGDPAGETWIPWAAVYDKGNNDGSVLVIPPRMIPHPIASFENTSSVKRNWLSNGIIPPGSGAARGTPYGDASAVSLMSLEQIVNEQLPRAYDRMDPRTWFPRESGRGTGTATPSFLARPAHEHEVHSLASTQGMGASVPLIVGGTAVAGTGLYFLGRALGWWK